MHVENITSNAMSLDRNGQSMLIQVYEKEIDRLNNIINELDEDIYSLYEDICNSDDTYCYRIPMEIIIDRLDKMSNKITKFNENKLKEEK